MHVAAGLLHCSTTAQTQLLLTRSVHATAKQCMHGFSMRCGHAQAQKSQTHGGLSGPLVDSSTFSSSFRMLSFLQFVCERKCLLHDSHQQGKIMIMIMKTPGSQVDSPVAEEKEEEERWETYTKTLVTERISVSSGSLLWCCEYLNK